MHADPPLYVGHRDHVSLLQHHGERKLGETYGSNVLSSLRSGRFTFSGPHVSQGIVATYQAYDLARHAENGWPTCHIS